MSAALLLCLVTNGFRGVGFAEAGGGVEGHADAGHPLDDAAATPSRFDVPERLGGVCIALSLRLRIGGDARTALSLGGCTGVPALEDEDSQAQPTTRCCGR